MSNNKLNYIPVLEEDRVSRYLAALKYKLISFGLWKQTEEIAIQHEILGHFKFLYIVTGSYTLTVNGVDYEIQGGDTILFPPAVTYSVMCEADSDLEFYFLHFDVAPIDKRNLLIMLLDLQGPAIYKGLMTPASVTNLKRLNKQALEHKPGVYYNISNLLHSTIFAALNSSEPSDLLGLASEIAATNEELIIQNCAQYIDTHIHEQILVDDLCSHVNVSQSYLYKCFTSVLGVSTKDFIQKHKLRKVSIELLSKNTPLQELADKYGFSSANHFSTVFKKYYGCSPSAYKQRHIDQINPENNI